MSDTREDLEARIAAYIDGELPPADAARLEVFLANTDPQLAEQIIGMLGDRHNLRILPKPKAPPELSARIMEQVERATLLNDIPHHEHQPRPWWQSRVAIAAGFTLLIGGFSFFVAKSVMGPRDNKFNHLAETQNPVAAPTSTTGASLALGGSPTASPLPPLVPSMSEARKSAAPTDERIASTGMFFKSGDLDKAAPAPAASPADAEVAAADKDLAQAEKTEAVLQTQLARNSDVLRSNQSSAAKMGYAAVESPARALANISAGNSTLASEPIVITLVAQDEHDFSRLRAALETIMSQDPLAARRQTALQARYLNVLNNGGNYLANGNRTGNNFDNGGAINNSISNSNNNSGNGSGNGSGGASGNMFKGGLRADELKIDPAASQAAASNAAPAPAGPAATAPALADNLDNALHYKIYSPKDRDFADVPPDATDSSEKTQANAAAGTPASTQPVVLDQLAQNLAASVDHPAAAAVPKDAVNEQRLSTEAQKFEAQGGGQAASQSKQTLNNVRHGTWENQGTPFYRVALRPEQLEQLAQQFRVDSITSGRQAYVITPETYNHPQNDDAFAQAETPTTEKAKEQSQALLKAESGSASIAGKDVAQAGKEPEDKNTQAKSSPTTTPYIYHLDLSKDGPWLECIITMEPRPTPPAPPASPTEQRQTK